MSATSIGVVIAAAKFSETDEATYIDVRTVPEFAGGRPKGKAINVPLEFYKPKTEEVFLNDAFLSVVEDNCGKDDELILGCDGGERATRAAEQLTAAGFKNLFVMNGGLPEWRAHQLRVTGDNRDGVSYHSLITKFRRKQKKKKKA
ncbi:MAG: rhodanese-like domain-containing protein [Pseudomonadota bacterium]